MSTQVPQLLFKTLLVFLMAALTVASARPSHFADSNQVVAEQDTNNLLNSDVKPLDLLNQLLLAQKLSEANGQSAQGDWDIIWQRGARSPESKRQSRYRQCYFNPISCFKK